MNETSRLWLEAAKVFSANSQAIVSCPECKVGKLKVRNEPIEVWNKIDCYLYCDTCGKYNVLTISKPDK
jgi:hypothetical protein